MLRPFGSQGASGQTGLEVLSCLVRHSVFCCTTQFRAGLQRATCSPRACSEFHCPVARVLQGSYNTGTPLMCLLRNINGSSLCWKVGAKTKKERNLICKSWSNALCMTFVAQHDQEGLESSLCKPCLRLSFGRQGWPCQDYDELSSWVTDRGFSLVATWY